MINKIGPAKVKRVVQELERIEVRLVDGAELYYRRVENANRKKV